MRGLVATLFGAANGEFCTQDQFRAMSAAFMTASVDLDFTTLTGHEYYTQISAAINASQYPCEPCLHTYVVEYINVLKGADCNEQTQNTCKDRLEAATKTFATCAVADPFSSGVTGAAVLAALALALIH
jgi:hypothetical protein